MMETSCQRCIVRGVAPVMCATLSSDMKLPATASVVQRNDAIMRMAMMPTLPCMPAPPMTTAETMIMKMVMPETGSLPV